MRALVLIAASVAGPAHAGAPLVTGPSPYAGAAAVLGRTLSPCPGRLSSVAVLGRDDGILSEEKPDVEVPAPAGRPALSARVSWTYLSAYSRKVGDLYARCRAAGGPDRTVALPLGIVSCTFASQALSCR